MKTNTILVLQKKLKEDIESIGLHVDSLKIIIYDVQAFGSYIAEAIIQGQQVIIINDRGQFFLKIYDKIAKKKVDAESIYPEILSAQLNLEEQLNILNNKGYFKKICAPEKTFKNS